MPRPLHLCAPATARSPPVCPQIVLLLDADFLPNRALSDLIHEPEHYDQLRRVTGEGSQMRSGAQFVCILSGMQRAWCQCKSDV